MIEIFMRYILSPAALVAIGISGCTVGPDYTPPAPQTPADWSAVSKNNQQNTGITATASDSANWWLTFNDAELTSLIERARDANPTVKQAGLRIEEARAQLSVADSRNLPHAALDNSYTRSRLSPNGALSLLGGGGGGDASSIGATGPAASTNIPSSFTGKIPPFDLFQTGFDASWEIDLFGGVRRSIESAEAQEQALIEQRNDALISVYAEVARDYVELRGVQRLIEITKSNLKAQEDAYRLTHAQAQGGEVSNFDVESASAEVATTQAQLPALEDQKIHMINAISLLVGREPEALEQELTVAKILPPTPPSVPIGMPSELAHRRPDIKRAEAEFHTATANIGVATADLYPKLSLSGSVGLQAVRFSKLSDWASRFYNFGPALSIPIFNGTTYANIDVREVQQKEAALTYETTVLNALHDVENTVSSYNAEKLRIGSLQHAAEANERSLSLAQQRYKAGLSSFLDVLDSERRLYASQTDVARSAVMISTNLIAVYKALGGGWESDSDTSTIH